MREKKVDMLTIFHKQLVEYIENHSSPFIYKRAAQRHYIISKKLRRYFATPQQLNIQDGEGDSAFTWISKVIRKETHLFLPSPANYYGPVQQNFRV